MALEPYLDGVSEHLMVFAVALAHGNRAGDDFRPARSLFDRSWRCSL